MYGSEIECACAGAGSLSMRALRAIRAGLVTGAFAEGLADDAWGALGAVQLGQQVPHRLRYRSRRIS